MSPFEAEETSNRESPGSICRGCLKRWGKMKNMYQAGLDVDYFKYTDIPSNPAEGLSELLCITCEQDLQNIKKFKEKCQRSDKILKSKLKKTRSLQPQERNNNQVIIVDTVEQDFNQPILTSTVDIDNYSEESIITENKNNEGILTTSTEVDNEQEILITIPECNENEILTTCSEVNNQELLTTSTEDDEILITIPEEYNEKEIVTTYPEGNNQAIIATPGEDNEVLITIPEYNDSEIITTGPEHHSEELSTTSATDDEILTAVSNITGRHVKTTKNNHYEVTTILTENKLLIKIEAPNAKHKIFFKCPYECCQASFGNTGHLTSHLKKSHDCIANLQLDLQYFCSEENCVYNKNAWPTKYFTGRKFLNQHIGKMHTDKQYMCENCHSKFSRDSDFYRHLKTCNLVYECLLCKSFHTNSETYLVHLGRKHPSEHAKYKERKAQKRPADKNNTMETILSKILKVMSKSKLESTNSHSPEDNSARNRLGVTEEKNGVAQKAAEQTANIIKIPKTVKPIKIKAIPTWRLKPIQRLNVTENSVIPIEYTPQPQTVEVIQGDSNTDPIVVEEIPQAVEETAVEVIASNDECFEEIIVDQEPLLEEVIDESKLTQDSMDITETIEAKDMLASEYVEECAFGPKKTSVTNDVSLNPWGNKTDFEIQRDEMSTQTVFADFLRSQDDIFFSESVSLSDIQTQTVPLEFGLTQNNKGTQSQPPGLSFKGTQTSSELFEDRNRNFKMFDNRSASPTSYISNATQTVSPIHSDVMLNCSATQTYYDDFIYASL